MTWLLALYVAFNPLHIPPTNARWPVLRVAAPAQITTNPDEPPEYADGIYCTPQGDRFRNLQTADHPCACKNMVRPGSDGECDVKMNNDAACKQWCHEQHCACPQTCVNVPPSDPSSGDNR